MEESEIPEMDPAVVKQIRPSVQSPHPVQPAIYTPQDTHPYSNFDVSHLVTLLWDLEISALEINMFLMETHIGSGGESANVHLNKFQEPGSPEVVAIVKQYAKLNGPLHSEHTIDGAFREVCTMQHPRLSKHPNILNLLGVSDSCDKLGGTSFSFAVVTEFAELGSLTRYLQKKLSWRMKSQLIHDCKEGLEALHACDIVHNDVKADNILLFPTNRFGRKVVAKIADFGCAVMLPSASGALGLPQRRRAGTLKYAPPNAYDATSVVDTCRDWYSFGLVVVHFATEAIPFVNLSDEEAWELKGDREEFERQVDHYFKSTPKVISNMSKPWMLPGSTTSRSRGKKSLFQTVRKLAGNPTPSTAVVDSEWLLSAVRRAKSSTCVDMFRRVVYMISSLT
jgi:serine/threonine protein kinase